MRKYCGICGKVHGYGNCNHSIDPRVRRIERTEYGRKWDVFLQSGIWRRKRLHILRRDNGICICCKNKYNRTTAATDIHHIEKINDTNKLDNSNLISLCKTCHNRVDTDCSYYDCKAYIDYIECIEDRGILLI